MMTFNNGRPRIAALVLAALTLAPAVFVASAGFAEAANTACSTIDYLVGSRAGAGLVTPGKTTAAQKAVPAQAGLMLALHTSGDAAWAIKDQETGALFAEGATTLDEPTVYFTQPSPFTRLCLEITNPGTTPFTFVYAFERLS